MKTLGDNKGVGKLTITFLYSIIIFASYILLQFDF